MIDRDHDLSIVRQAKVLKLARSTVYYEPRPVSAEDLALMRRLDELHLDYPFAGARMLRSLLRREGVYRRSPPHRDADEAHGDRGGLSSPEHEPPWVGQNPPGMVT
ncbi:hypothetical protein ACVIHA_007029 [Bradyrhizobium liaoningense]